MSLEPGMSRAAVV